MIINIYDLVNVTDQTNFRIEGESLYKKFDDPIKYSDIKYLSREITISKVHIIESSGNSEPDKSYIGVMVDITTTLINDILESKYLLRCKDPTVYCLAEEFVNSDSVENKIICR